MFDLRYPIQHSRHLAWKGLRPFSLLLAVLPCLVLWQCRSQPAQSNGLAILLESQPGCPFPCWLGVMPGASTEAEVAAIAAANPTRFDDLARNTFGGRFVQFIWRDRDVDSLMSMELENDIVTHIVALFEAGSTLQAVFDKLGQPDAYATYLSKGERPAILLYLFYESLGVVVETELPPSEAPIVECRYDLPGSAVVERLYLVPVTTAPVTLERLPQLFFRHLRPSLWSGSNGLELSAGCPS